jgi:dUTP pyrophosphatase
MATHKTYAKLSIDEMAAVATEYDADERVIRALCELNDLREHQGGEVPVPIFLAPGAILPHYKSAGAACADLHAYLTAPITVQPERCMLIPTGVHVAIPSGWEWQIRPRSGLSAHAHWVAFGTVDSDYRGEVQAILLNLSSWPLTVAPGDRIAQAKLERATRAAWQPVARVEDLGTTVRGSGGFGSSGR